MAKQPKARPLEENEGNNMELDAALAGIRKRFGEGSIMQFGDTKPKNIEVIPTGSLSLDIALGVFGVPRGRIIEIYGPESSGKTTLALHVAAQAQKQGGVSAFIDAEHAMDPEYAKRIGVDLKHLLISQPDTGEQALEIVEALVRSGSVSLIIVDSVAALTPRAEIEGEMGDMHLGLQARLMSQALRKLTAIADKTRTTVIFINQIRMKIGVMFGNPETTTGGNALKFYSSLRVEVRRAAQIKQGEEIIGNRVRAKVVKNKVAPPFRTAEFDILYDEGISYQSDVLNVGVRYNVISRSGSWFLHGDQRLGQGMEAARKYLVENPKILKELDEKIRKAVVMEA